MLVASGIMCLTCSGKHKADRNPAPNIIFIMTDDHTSRAVSCYGSGINQTPNIDKIARQGILFTSAFVTNSICAPSRAVVLTGMHSHLNGVMTNSIPFDTAKVTFPKILRENGYETAIIGKWHLQSRPAGFDYWNVLTGQGDYYNPRLVEMGRDTVYQGYATDIEIAAREIMRVQDIIRNILVKHTGQTMEKIAHDTDRDFYLNSEQAVEYGLIDEVLRKPEEGSAKTTKK